MTAPLAIAANVTSYSARTPYITPAEYSHAPTAVAATNLVQGGTDQANAYELINVIARASALADELCFGKDGCLAATTDIDGPRWLRVKADGTLKFKTRFGPILQVNAISAGRSPSSMLAMVASGATDLLIEPEYDLIGIPVLGSFGSLCAGADALVTVQYVNGYPATTLNATAQAGDTTIDVLDGTGIYPGSMLTIYDDFPGGEDIFVASSYVPSYATVPMPATLPLTTALQFTHTEGVSISNLPPSVKQAAIHLTTALIKTRGALSVVAGKLAAGPTKTTGSTSSGADKDMQAAQTILRPYMRVR